MRNPKELFTLYVDASMHNIKQESNKKARDYGVLVTVYPKRLEAFCSFIQDEMYKGNTVIDHCIKYFKVPKKHQKSRASVEKYLLSKNSTEFYKPLIEKFNKEVSRKIDSLFEKNRVELNNLIKKISI